MSTFETLGRWPVTVEFPVAWGEMDAFQHVNNVTYLRWFESARIAYFEATGMMDRMKGSGVGPILARAVVDYRLPVTYPDRAKVSCTVTSFGNTSFVMRYRLTTERTGTVAAEGETVIVMVDYRSGKKVPVDDVLRQAILSLEATGQG
jgi:acyl-CoA thioester hydrolase